MMDVKKIIATVILASFLSFLLININVISLGMALFIILLPIFITYPHIYFISFILTRPLLDLWAGMGIGGINLASFFTISLILICGLDIFVKKENWDRITTNIFLRWFNKFFISFLFASLFSFVNTDNFLVSLADFLRLISILIAVNYVVIHFSNSEKVKKLIKFVLFSSIIPLCFGLYQFISKTGIAEKGFNRIYGTFTHCNVFAEYLLLIFFLSLFIASTYRVKKIAKFALFCFLFLILFELYNTFTRTVWIALGISFFIYVLIKNKISKKIGYLLLITFIFLLFFPYIQRRFEDITRKMGYQTSSLEWRIDLWQRSIGDMKEHPFIGNGLGMYEYKIGVMAHNDFFRIAYEVGFPAACIFLALYFYILFFSSNRISKLSLNSEEKDKFKISVCLIVGLLISSLAINTLRSTLIIFYYFSSIVVLIQKRNDSEKFLLQNRN